MSTQLTREKLITGALETVRERGATGVSARVVAARAGVNQALVFYHFGSVDELLAEACRVESARRVALYRDSFGAANSLRELLAVGRELNTTEQAAGNVALLAQLLAASHGNPVLRSATAEAMQLWADEVERTLRRLLAAGPFDGLLDPAALAHALSAAFIGFELFETVAPEHTELALGELARLGHIAEAVEGLGPVARRAVRARLSRSARS